jgi:hypothetical protein
MNIRTATYLALSSLLVLALRADPIGVQAQAHGLLVYPNQGPDSSGNETGVTFDANSGVIPGDGHATAQITATRTGTDASTGPDHIGTSGTTTLSESVEASLGHLAASGNVTAESNSNGGSSVFYPHGHATVGPWSGPTARFDDITTVYNANYALGASIPVELTLFLDWHAGFDLGTAGLNSALIDALATLAVDGAGNVSVYDLMQSDRPMSTWTAGGPQTLSFTMANGSAFSWYTSLTINTDVFLAGTYESADLFHFPVVSASAFSNATIDIIPTSDLAGTTFTSTTGHVYGGDTPASVPDATSTIALLGLGLGGLGFARLRAQAA